MLCRFASARLEMFAPREIVTTLSALEKLGARDERVLAACAAVLATFKLVVGRKADEVEAAPAVPTEVA